MFDAIEALFDAIEAVFDAAEACVEQAKAVLSRGAQVEDGVHEIGGRRLRVHTRRVSLGDVAAMFPVDDGALMIVASLRMRASCSVVGVAAQM